MLPHQSECFLLISYRGNYSQQVARMTDGNSGAFKQSELSNFGGGHTTAKMMVTFVQSERYALSTAHKRKWPSSYLTWPLALAGIVSASSVHVVIVNQSRQAFPVHLYIALSEMDS